LACISTDAVVDKASGVWLAGMAANCHAAAAALHLAENSAYKALVSSLNETQLEQLGEVLLAAMSESATGGANSSNAQANPHAEAVDSAFAILPNVACIEPRGRWDILFSEQAIFFRNKKGVVQKVGKTVWLWNFAST